MLGMNKLAQHERFTKLKLPSHEFRQSRGDLIESYRILDTLYNLLTTKTLLTLDSPSITDLMAYNFKKIK